ncbi:hypothetical protein SAMD00023353_3900920 [Rosellinia necatrix]|uniref:Zn(2)-C6 fungal-type domain-containing protein n=1 Tax=Rosellinia necatrix TaxID=77044 RepID=A0A1S7UPH6_ROSNE|nr:hypothetical protein SAMD00023353_3900920 [Rosellinia necatrix]
MNPSEWREAVRPGQISDEVVGIANIFSACSELWLLATRVLSQQGSTKKGIIRKLESGRQYLNLWADGYSVLDGRFEDGLKKSQRAGDLTIRLMQSICRVLAQELVPCIASIDISGEGADLSLKAADLVLSSEKLAVLVQGDDDSDASSNSGSIAELESISCEERLENIADDLRNDTQCLLDLGARFEEQVMNPIIIEATADETTLAVVGSSQIFVNRVLWFYPHCERNLCRRLGEATSMQVSRIQKLKPATREVQRTPNSRSGIFQNGFWFCNCEPRLLAETEVVRRNSPNYGRRFYMCPQIGNRCNMFLFVEDAIALEKASATEYVGWQATPVDVASISALTRTSGGRKEPPAMSATSVAARSGGSGGPTELPDSPYATTSDEDEDDGPAGRARDPDAARGAREAESIVSNVSLGISHAPESIIFHDSGVGTSIHTSEGGYGAVLASLGNRTYPRLPEGATKGIPFQCTVCRKQMTLTTEAEWREHLLSDVQPYVCPETECDAHIFATIPKWQKHMDDTHPTASIWNDSDCRICQIPVANKDAVRQHLINHMEDLALAVVPSTTQPKNAIIPAITPRVLSTDKVTDKSKKQWKIRPRCKRCQQKRYKCDVKRPCNSCTTLRIDCVDVSLPGADPVDIQSPSKSQRKEYSLTKTSDSKPEPSTAGGLLGHEAHVPKVRSSPVPPGSDRLPAAYPQAGRPPTPKFPTPSTGSPQRGTSLAPASVDDGSSSVAAKRARNTLAARKSRERRVRQLEEMEERIAELERERDFWLRKAAPGHGEG